MNKAEWVTYLTSIGIPRQDAVGYAPEFVQQQVQKKSLQVLTDEELQESFGFQLRGHPSQ